MLPISHEMQMAALKTSFQSVKKRIYPQKTRMGARVAKFLKEKYPNKAAANVAADLKLPINQMKTVERWLAGYAPKNKHLDSMQEIYRLPFVRAIFSEAFEAGDNRLIEIENINNELVQISTETSSQALPLVGGVPSSYIEHQSFPIITRGLTKGLSLLRDHPEFSWLAVRIQRMMSSNLPTINDLQITGQELAQKRRTLLEGLLETIESVVPTGADTPPLEQSDDSKRKK